MAKKAKKSVSKKSTAKKPVVKAKVKAKPAKKAVAKKVVKKAAPKKAVKKVVKKIAVKSVKKAIKKPATIIVTKAVARKITAPKIATSNIARLMPTVRAGNDNTASKPTTLYDKIWKDHLVHEAADGTCLLYIDRHLVHEVTSPQGTNDGSQQGHCRRRKPHPGRNPCDECQGIRD
jgi:hypothetical protein